MSIEPTDQHFAIVPYRPEYRAAFERLNRAWLEAHDLLEQADLDHLQNPEAHILAAGGQIFFAVDGGTVIGTCAAIRISESTVELAKLGVDPAAQGRGVGRQLCNVVLQFARELGATAIFLTSHTDLAPAIRLYESLGFRHEPIPAKVRYASANVYMTLSLAR